MGRIDHTQLSFPLRAFVILRLHKDDIIDTNTAWESSDNVLRVPYNYLKSFNFGTQLVDGGPGGTISIFDPYIGEITNFVTRLRQFADNTVDVLWGWQDENEQIRPAGSGYVMGLSKLGVKFENGGMLYDLEMVAYGIKELYVAKVNQDLMKGIFDHGKKVSPVGILKEIIINYNKTKKNNWPKIELRTNWKGGIDGLIKEENKKLEYYAGDSKPIVQVAMDLIKSTKISYKDWVHLRLIVSSNIEIMNNNVILFIKIESEATQSYNVPLDTLYDNAMYFYNKNERGNVLNMDLNYEHWLGIIGTSFQVGVVNKQTGKYEMVINDDNQNSNTYIPAGIGPLRPVPMKDSSQGGDDNPILLNSQTAEAGVLDDVQTPEAVKKWINSMQSRLRSIQMNGSITVLGDPNIYDNIEHLDNKYIELAVYDNEQQIVPGYSSKYKVLAWEHNIEMGKWVTKIYITSLYQEDNVVLERYKRNNFVEK